MRSLTCVIVRARACVCERERERACVCVSICECAREIVKCIENDPPTHTPSATPTHLPPPCHSCHVRAVFFSARSSFFDEDPSTEGYLNVIIAYSPHLLSLFRVHVKHPSHRPRAERHVHAVITKPPLSYRRLHASNLLQIWRKMIDENEFPRPKIPLYLKAMLSLV